MTPLKVVIRNFQSIREATVYLGNRGLVSVEGRNLDKGGAKSNGSGKSTLINAILWNLFGDSGKKLKSVDDVVRYDSKGGTAVETYWQDETNDTKYGITRFRKHPKYKNSLLVYLITDDGLVDITKGTASATQELVQSIIGCDQKTFEASCFQRQGDAAPDIPGMTDGELKALLEKVLPFDDLAPLYKVACRNRDDQIKAIGLLDHKLSMFMTRRGDAEHNLAATIADSAKWEDQASRRVEELDINIAIFEEEIANTKRDLKPQDKLDAAIAKYQAMVDGYDDGPRQRYLAESDSLRNAVLKAFGAMKSLTDSCPTCSRPYDNYAQALEVATNTLNNARAAQDIHNKDAQIYIDARAAHEQDRLKLGKLEMANRTQERMLNNIRRAEDQIGVIQARKLETPTNPHLEAIKRLEEAIRGYEADMLHLTTQLSEEDAKLQVLSAVADTYSPKGVRYHILETATPKLNERTNYYLNQLTDGAMKAIWSTVKKLKTGEYKEQFSIDVSGEGFGSYGSLSGGEQRKVRLACFFALQDLIADRATKDIKLWCGDEIDHALDPAGLERLMALLHEKVKKKETILVISHNELREWIPNTTTVTKKDKVSTITGYLSEQRN